MTSKSSTVGSASYVQEINTFNKKNALKRDILIGVVGLAALGAFITIAHFCHIPSMGTAIGGVGIGLGAIALRSVLKKTQKDKPFYPLDPCEPKASPNVKKFWEKANRFLADAYKGLKVDQNEIVKAYLANKEELGDVFGDLLIKLRDSSFEIDLLNNEQTTEFAQINERVGDYLALEKMITAFRNQQGSLKDVLQKVQEITKKFPLPPSLLEGIKGGIDQLLLSLSPNKILDLVHVINENPSSISYELIHQISLKAKSIFPLLSSYFTIDNTETKLRGAGFDKIAKNYQSDPSFKIYPTVKEENLASAIRTFMQDPEVKKGAFPVGFDRDLSFHFAPLYIEKTKDNQLRLFISDSLGFHSDFCPSILKRLGNLPIKDIYVLEPQRQFSHSVCSIFTLNDIIEISKIDSLFAILDKDPYIEESYFGSIPLMKVQNPPAGMMKMAQSLSRVKTFMETKGNKTIQASGLEILDHRAEELSALVEEVSTFENVETVPKKQSKFAYWGLTRCFEMLLLEAAKSVK